MMMTALLGASASLGPGQTVQGRSSMVPHTMPVDAVACANLIPLLRANERKQLAPFHASSPAAPDALLNNTQNKLVHSSSCLTSQHEHAIVLQLLKQLGMPGRHTNKGWQPLPPAQKRHGSVPHAVSAYL
jgi:hypothetical protein